MNSEKVFFPLISDDIKLALGEGGREGRIKYLYKKVPLLSLRSPNETLLSPNYEQID